MTPQQALDLLAFCARRILVLEEVGKYNEALAVLNQLVAAAMAPKPEPATAPQAPS